MVIMGVSGSGESTLLHALTAGLGWPWLEAVAVEMSRWTANGISAGVACSALGWGARDRLRAADPGCLFVYSKADLPLIENCLKSSGSTNRSSRLSRRSRDGPTHRLRQG